MGEYFVRQQTFAAGRKGHLDFKKLLISSGSAAAVMARNDLGRLIGDKRM